MIALVYLKSRIDKLESRAARLESELLKFAGTASQAPDTDTDRETAGSVQASRTGVPSIKSAETLAEKAKPGAGPTPAEPVGPWKDQETASEHPGPWIKPEAPSAQPAPLQDGADGSGSMPPPVKSGSGREPRDLEQTIGSRWAIWIGGLAFALGGLFLVKYSIERGVFGPGVRILMATVAGAGSMIVGEYIRRRDVRIEFAGDRAAQVPAILTAAGAAILFGVIYAAHNLFGFIGPAAAFVLLAMMSIATIMLSLLHGSSLAALGLVGSFATPALVDSNESSIWILFSYLGVILVASTALARYRKTGWIAAAALAGTFLWVLPVTAFPDVGFSAYQPLYACVLMLGSVALIWLHDRQGEPTFLARFTSRPALPVHAAVTMVTLVALAMVVRHGWAEFSMSLVVLIMIALLLGFTAWKDVAAAAIVAGLVLALAALGSFAANGLAHIVFFRDGIGVANSTDAPAPESRYVGFAVALSALYFVLASFSAERDPNNRLLAIAWTLSAIIAAIAAYGLSVFLFADLNIDTTYGLAGIGAAAAYSVSGLWIARREDATLPLLSGSAVMLAGSAAFLAAAIHLLTTPAWTAIVLGAVVLVLGWLSLRTIHAVIPWLAVAFGAIIFLRIPLNPAIADPDLLSATPVFNWILAGHGVPAAAFAACAIMFRKIDTPVPLRFMEGFAVTQFLVGLALLARHYMSGGVLEAGGPDTLAEQSLYTLLALGASFTLIRLDDRSPSPVFRAGSMIVGYGGLVAAVFNHFVFLNPVFSHELMGDRPVLNILALAYLLPGLLSLAVWNYARSRRPWHYVLALRGACFLFLAGWVVFTVRHSFVGSDLATIRTSMAEGLTYAPAMFTAAVLCAVLARRFLRDVLYQMGSAFAVAAALLFGLFAGAIDNPLLTGEPVGGLVFNLVAVGYLLPALLTVAYMFAATHATGRWVGHLRIASGAFTAVSGFLWLNMTIRRYFQGSEIGLERVTYSAETYTYSLVWLLAGVGLLAAGTLANSRTLRIASAAIVTLTIVKVFLIDMRELEGVLRAFSFMGLGASLIGIGLFYQRILGRSHPG